MPATELNAQRVVGAQFPPHDRATDEFADGLFRLLLLFAGLHRGIDRAHEPIREIHLQLVRRFRSFPVWRTLGDRSVSEAQEENVTVPEPSRNTQVTG